MLDPYHIIALARSCKTFALFFLISGLVSLAGALALLDQWPSLLLMGMGLSAFSMGLTVVLMANGFIRCAERERNNACPACTDQGHGYADYAAVPCEVCGGSGFRPGAALTRRRG